MIALKCVSASLAKISRWMIRAYEFLLRPTVRQEQALGEMLRDHCSLYVAALQERRDACRHVSKSTVTYGMRSARLKEIRAYDPERQGRWSFSSQQATLRRPDKAVQAFFRRVKSGDTPGYPRFRGVNWFDTVEFPRDGGGCRRNSTPHDPVTRVRLQGIGHIRVDQHRAVAGRGKTISVKHEGHGKVLRRRLDHAQETALDLVRAHDVIAHEDLEIRNMSRTPPQSPTPTGSVRSCPTGPPPKPD